MLATKGHFRGMKHLITHECVCACIRVCARLQYKRPISGHFNVSRDARVRDSFRVSVILDHYLPIYNLFNFEIFVYSFESICAHAQYFWVYYTALVHVCVCTRVYVCGHVMSYASTLSQKLSLQSVLYNYRGNMHLEQITSFYQASSHKLTTSD